MRKNYKNLSIETLSFNSKKALILSHGGYTPERLRILKGSGFICIPQGIHIEFNSEEDRPSIGTKAAHLLSGFDIAPVDEYCSGQFIRNYSLSHNPLFDNYTPTREFDLIRIVPGKKAHMSDIFESFQRLNLSYDIVRSFACRVNKITYDF